MLLEYNPTTGEIFHVMQDPLPPGTAELYAQLEKNFVLYEGPLPSYQTHYIAGGNVLQRIDLPATIAREINDGIVPLAADGIDELVIEDLPIPCTVQVDGEPVEVVDGSFEFSTTMPATYKILIDYFPFLPLQLTIVAE